MIRNLTWKQIFRHKNNKNQIHNRALKINFFKKKTKLKITKNRLKVLKLCHFG